MDMNIFARLCKYDEKTGYFEAMAADETLDKSQEIFDYDLSKPNFVKWSAEFEKSTNGASKGNVRAMHGKVAAGKLTSIEFLDDKKGIFVKGLVVDPVEKTKMASGLYTGLSIGGSYGKKWEDPAMKGVTRYEAIPSEISIVDNPCNPGAMFTMVKADGVQVEKHFDANVASQTIGQIWKCAIKGHEHEKKAEAEACTADVTEKMRKGTAVEGVRPEFATSIGVDLAKLAPAKTTEGIDTASKSPEQLEIEKKLDPRVKDFDADQMAVFEKWLPHVADREALTLLVTKVAAREDVNPKEGKDKYGDVDFADEKNKKYPIDTAAHIKAAWNYINKSKNAKKYSTDDVATMKKKIVAAWKDKIDKDGPPSAKEASKAVLDLCLRKGLYTLGCVGGILEQLCWQLESYQIEQAIEGDDSDACKMLEEARDALAGALKAMAAEEIDEILGTGEDVEVMEMSAAIGNLTKHYKEMVLYVPPKGWPETVTKAAQASIDGAKVEEREAMAKSLGMKVLKVGARHSAKDKDHLQAIHDHASDMGADCDHSECGADKGVRTGNLAKVEAELASTTVLRNHLAKQVVSVAKILGLPGDADAADIVEPVTKMHAELIKLRAQPEPPKGNVLDVDAINDIDPARKNAKGAGAEDAPIYKRDGVTLDREAMAQRSIRKAHGFTK